MRRLDANILYCTNVPGIVQCVSKRGRDSFASVHAEKGLAARQRARSKRLPDMLRSMRSTTGQTVTGLGNIQSGQFLYLVSIKDPH